MSVQINRSDQLIGSNWIRKTNSEKHTVGHVLPTVGRRLSAKGYPMWASQGLWRKMYEFLLQEGVPTTREIWPTIFSEYCLAYKSHYKNAEDL